MGPLSTSQAKFEPGEQGKPVLTRGGTANAVLRRPARSQGETGRTSPERAIRSERAGEGS